MFKCGTTKVIRLDEGRLKNGEGLEELLREPAHALALGGLVCFPTETVYGLGANALDGNAVEGIFRVKGRPSDNPLIVHVDSKDGVGRLVRRVPPKAERLMDAFWPGPLTIIMEKDGRIPKSVTAGLDTVGIRMPANPVALVLIRLSGVPVAAPSANISGKPSPTLSAHVEEDLAGKVDYIIDGGMTGVGIESTVLDLTSEVPVILRPGGVTYEQLRDAVGHVEVDPGIAGHPSIKPKAPGMKYRHYAPDAEVFGAVGSLEDMGRWLEAETKAHRALNKRVGVLCSEELSPGIEADRVVSWGTQNDAAGLAACLYSVLRDMDAEGIDVVLVQGVGSEGMGAAVMNRLLKATGNRIAKL